jgi:hypothetical protein
MEVMYMLRSHMGKRDVAVLVLRREVQAGEDLKAAGV